MRRAMSDLRLALRLMWQRPGFTALAVLMLALGTGANAAMFSVIDGVLLRSPFGQPGQIAMVAALTANGQRTSALPRAEFERFAALTHIFAAVAERSIGSPVATGIETPRRTQVECLPAAMAAVLGTSPSMGRWYSSVEDRPNGPGVVLIGDAFWRSSFGRDPHILGRTFALDGEPVAIIGVLPPGFDGPLSLPNRDIYAPYGQVTAGRARYGCRPPGETVNAFVRLQPNRTPAEAEAALNAALGSPARFVVSSHSDEILGDVRGPVLLLTGAVIAVLIIACANVANLGLERQLGRRREIAVRLALGATSGRIVRQTIVDHLLQAAVGASAGVIVAALSLDALVALLPRSLPHTAGITMNGRVLAATIGLTLLGGVLVGLVSVLQTTSTSVRDGLAAGTRTTSGGSRRIRSALVVMELALGVALLVLALLMVRTFLTLRPTSPGFDPDNKLIAQVRLPAGMTLVERWRFVDDVRTAIGREPGVSGVAATTYLLMSRSISAVEMAIGDVTGEIWTGTVTGNYFDLMGLPIRRGRGFEDSNTGAGPAAMIVNEAFARRWLPDRDPLGASVTIGGKIVPRIDGRIVGVIADTRTAGLDTRVRPQLYLPMAQTMMGSPYFVVSASPAALVRLPAVVRDIVARTRPGQLVDRVETYHAMLATEVATPRFGAWLFGLFAGLAVTLAVLGLAATLGWSVTARRREIGVRMALGADRRRVSGLIVGQTLRYAVPGVVLGLLVAAWMTRWLQGWLYGVTSLDAMTFATCAGLMLALSVVAAYAPARRAATVDPLVALRTD